MNESVLASWRAVNGDDTLRINYDIPDNAIIFDLGGYKGEWTDKILSKYPKAFIYVFEPVKEFYNYLTFKYKYCENVKVFNFGLGSRTCKAFINLDDNCSSVVSYKSGLRVEEISLVDINVFCLENRITYVNLMKVNIEGSEYDLLEHICNTSVSCFNNIQVQFHDFVPDAIEKRNKIQEELSKTHIKTYDYPFVWESWTIGEWQE